jgi:hypothetical protein
MVISVITKKVISMKNSRNDDTNRRLDRSINLTSTEAERQQLMAAISEPFVDADNIAVFISEPRKNVVRMAREGKLTSYPISGSKRHVYKFKRSEVSMDLEKIRRPSSTPPNDNSEATNPFRKN